MKQVQQLNRWVKFYYRTNNESFKTKALDRIMALESLIANRKRKEARLGKTKAA